MSDYQETTLPGGGMGDDDDKAAMAQWEDNNQGTWRLEAWSKSPRQMQDEERAMNRSYMGMVAGPATKHNQPRLPPNRMRKL
jgi:hypothetical protein